MACSDNLSQLSFPQTYRLINKFLQETTQALHLLESQRHRVPGKISYSSYMMDVVSFLPSIIPPGDPFNFTEKYRALQEIGFSFKENKPEPEFSVIVRIPKYFKFVAREKLEIFQEEVPVEQYSRFEVNKRKRESLQSFGIIYTHHEGVTNAIKRRMRVKDFLLN